MQVDGTKGISQDNDKLVWKTLFAILETRMQNGEFTVIDATNSKTAEMKRYKDLANTYRYRMYCIDMTDIPIEEVKRRNKLRDEIKQVPEEVIDKMYSRFETQSVPTCIKVLKPDELDTIWYKPMDLDDSFNCWSKVHVIGDIHGCYTVLKNYLDMNGGFKSDELFVFCGDYIDRGIENAEVINLLCEQCHYPNVILLEGNHECFHKNTEVLTENGWVKISDINTNDKVAQFNINTNLISFANPINKIKKFAEKLICIEGNDTKQIVTENHDVVYLNQKIKAKDLVNKEISQHGFILSGYCNDIDYNITDNELKLVTWIITDGTIVDNRKYNQSSMKRRIQFKLSREDKISKITSLLNDLNIEYTITKCGEKRENRKQVYVIRIYGETARYYCDTILNNSKHYPDFFRLLSRRQALIVLNELINTDGTIVSSVKYNFSCIEKKDVDIIQEMCIKNGISCTIRTKNNSAGFNKNGQIYTVNMKPFGVFGNHVIDYKYIEYNDTVYCLTMPEGTLVTRYDGKVAFSGNCHLRNWSNELTSKSKEFEFCTKPQLEKAGVSKKDVREFCRKLSQCCYFKFNGNYYLVTHGGISNVPENLLMTPTYQMIKGVGKYEDAEAVDYAFLYNTESNLYQIHGHRNITNLPIQTTARTFNLEGQVEFGGCLRAIQITRDGIVSVEIKNDVFKKPEEKIKEVQQQATVDMSVYNMVENMRRNKYIFEKKFGRVSSFNFGKQAFERGIWDDMTNKARGMFVDNIDYKIVARSYDKFFNINERPETQLANLRYKLHFPVTAYVKENGFLGIVGWNPETDDLLITSKSSPISDFSGYLKDNLVKLYGESSIEMMKQFIKENDVSFVFECCDMEHDPHIIEYPKTKVVLLDIVKNQIQYEKLPYETLVDIANKFGFEVKEKAYVIESWEDFFAWYHEVNAEDYKYNDQYIEGFVVEDATGYMVKMKLHYYKFWKRLRGVAQSVIKHGHYKYMGSLLTPFENEFFGWCKNLHQTLSAEDRRELADKSYTNIVHLRKTFLEWKEAHDKEVK